MFLSFFFTIHAFVRRRDRRTNISLIAAKTTLHLAVKTEQICLVIYRVSQKNEPLYCDDTFVKC